MEAKFGAAPWILLRVERRVSITEEIVQWVALLVVYPFEEGFEALAHLSAVLGESVLDAGWYLVVLGSFDELCVDEFVEAVGNRGGAGGLEVVFDVAETEAVVAAEHAEHGHAVLFAEDVQYVAEGYIAVGVLAAAPVRRGFICH